MHGLGGPVDAREGDTEAAVGHHVDTASVTGFAQPWRVVLPTMFVALWLGFTLLPETHALLRIPAAIALAGLVGLGCQLGGRLPQRPHRRTPLATVWIIPSGGTLAAVAWLSPLPERWWLLPPACALLIVGLVFLQTVELTGPDGVRAAAHAMNIGAGFALAYGAYVLAYTAPALVAVALNFAVSTAVALVVLRSEGEFRRDRLEYAAVAAVAVAELGWVLYGSRASAFSFAAVLVLGLYATSGICHAILDRAPIRAYVEVATVTLISLGAIVIAGGRA